MTERHNGLANDVHDEVNFSRSDVEMGCKSESDYTTVNDAEATTSTPWFNGIDTNK